jgi:hypothetical protein
MKFEILSRFYKLQGLIIAFYAVWISLLAGSFALLFVLENKTIVIAVVIPLLLITSAIFSIYINRRLKVLNRRFDKESSITEPPIET